MAGFQISSDALVSTSLEITITNFNIWYRPSIIYLLYESIVKLSSKEDI